MNQYIVIKTMGRGAYGKVKLCLDSQTHELYAIKVVNHSRATRRPRALPGARQAHSTLDADVVQEIAVMKQLDHPNIVRLVEVIGEAPHRVAWHMQGAGQADSLCRPARARSCMHQLADGISEAGTSMLLQCHASGLMRTAACRQPDTVHWRSIAWGVGHCKHVSAVHELRINCKREWFSGSW